MVLFKIMLSAAMVCVFVAGSVSFGSNWNGVDGNDWTEPNNWMNGEYPSPTGDAWITKMGAYPVSVVCSNVQTNSVSLGFWSWDGQLDIANTGTLTVATSTIIGHWDAGDGVGRTGLLNINGGIYNSGTMLVGSGYNGSLNLNGGQLNVTGSMVVGDGRSGRVNILDGVATIGGVLYMGLSGGTSLINIETGTLILHNDPAGYITDGKIIAYNGIGMVVNTDNGDGSWTVTGIANVNSQKPQFITGPRLLKLGESIEFSFSVPNGTAPSGELTVFKRYLEQAQPPERVVKDADLTWLDSLPSQNLTLSFSNGCATVSYKPDSPGNYIARWRVGNETLYRYFAAIDDDWTVVRYTTGGDWRPNFHGTGIPLEYRLEIEKFTAQNPDLGWHIDYQRRYGDGIIPFFPDTPDLTVEQRATTYGEGLERVRQLLPDPGDARAVHINNWKKNDPGYIRSLQKLDVLDQGGMWESNGGPWLGMPEFPYFASPLDMRKPNQGSGGSIVAHQWDFCGSFHFLGPMSWHYVVSEGNWDKTEKYLRQSLTEAKNLTEMSGHPAFFMPMLDGILSVPINYPECSFVLEPWDLITMTQYHCQFIYNLAFRFPKDYKLAFARSLDIAEYYKRHFPATPQTIFVSKTDDIDYDHWWMAGYAHNRILSTTQKIPWATRVPTLEYQRSLRKKEHYVYKDALSCEYIVIEDQHRSMRFERECPNPIWWFDYTRQEEEIGPNGSTITWVAMPEVIIQQSKWQKSKLGSKKTLKMVTESRFSDYAIALWDLPGKFNLAPDPRRIKTSANIKKFILAKNKDNEYHLVLFFDLVPKCELNVIIHNEPV